MALIPELILISIVGGAGVVVEAGADGGELVFGQLLLQEGEDLAFLETDMRFQLSRQGAIVTVDPGAASADRGDQPSDLTMLLPGLETERVGAFAKQQCLFFNEVLVQVMFPEVLDIALDAGQVHVFGQTLPDLPAKEQTIVMIPR